MKPAVRLCSVRSNEVKKRKAYPYWVDGFCGILAIVAMFYIGRAFGPPEKANVPDAAMFTSHNQPGDVPQRNPIVCVVCQLSFILGWVLIGSATVFIVEKVKQMKEEAVKELKEVAERVEEQCTKYENQMKNRDELIEIKSRLQEENQELMREMAQLRSDHLHEIHALNFIHVMLVLQLDNQQKKIEELEGKSSGSRSGHPSATTRRIGRESRRSSISMPSINSSANAEKNGHGKPTSAVSAMPLNASIYNKMFTPKALPGASTSGQCDDRFSELYRRNHMVPSHLRSCYPAETIKHDNKDAVENTLKQLPQQGASGRRHVFTQEEPPF